MGDNSIRLYHYTTAAAFHSIISKNSLWATRLEFMNDASEGAIFEDYLQEKIFCAAKAYFEKRSAAKIPGVPDFLGMPHHLAQMRSNALLGVVREILSNHYVRYVISFSEHPQNTYVSENGLLSQWRGYGAAGGICLIFDRQKIETSVAHLNSNFAGKCCFNGVQYVSHPKEVEAVFPPKSWEPLPNAIDDYFGSYQNDRTQPIPHGLHEAIEPFVKVAPFVKHRGFEEEAESRIVIAQYSLKAAEAAGIPITNVNEVKFRPRGERLIPYLDVFCGAIKDALSSIIIGPGANSWHNRIAVEAVLRQNNIDVPIAVSRTTFE